MRRYGRCKGGERVYDERPGNPAKNVTLVGVMSDEGLIADMTLPGGLNTPSFLAYLEKILRQQLCVGAIVVMDNFLFIMAKPSKVGLNLSEKRVKFLSPYSPDLFPIELYWSKIQVILCYEAS